MCRQAERSRSIRCGRCGLIEVASFQFPVANSNQFPVSFHWELGTGNWELKTFYPSLNAVVGSKPAARRAGSHDDTAVMAKNTTTIAANVSGSVAFTPTSIV